MDLDRRQTVECLHHGTVGELQRIVDALALDHFRCHRGGRHRRTAAERLELAVRDRVLVDFQVHFHDVAALGIADLADAVGIFNFTHIARVDEVIHHFFAVIHIIRPP